MSHQKKLRAVFQTSKQLIYKSENDVNLLTLKTYRLSWIEIEWLIFTHVPQLQKIW